MSQSIMLARLGKPALLTMAITSLFGCSAIDNTVTLNHDTQVSSEAAATLYYNGDIITMAGDTPDMVEALVTQDGKIAYVGSLKAAQAKYKNAAHVDLKNHTLLPSFIDRSA